MTSGSFRQFETSSMADYMLTITFAATYEESDADEITEALLDCSEELGPVVDIDASRALAVTVGVEAQEDFAAMIATPVGAISTAMEVAGVAAHDLVDIHLSRPGPHGSELPPA